MKSSAPVYGRCRGSQDHNADSVSVSVCTFATFKPKKSKEKLEALKKWGKARTPSVSVLSKKSFFGATRIKGGN